jgi:hypothetical protein
LQYRATAKPGSGEMESELILAALGQASLTPTFL